MTVEQAIRAADGMRPNNPYAPETKYRWLRECDALIRTQVVVKSATGDYEGVGADYAGEEMDELTDRWTWRWARATGRPTSWRSTTRC